MSRMDGGVHPANSFTEKTNQGPEHPQRRQRRMAQEDQENSTPEFHANNLGGVANGPR